MGTIPAPNIVEAAAQISQNPLTEYARATALQDNADLIQQQKQHQAQQIEVQRRGLADQDATTDAFLKWDHKDPNELAAAVVKNGGSATAAQAIQQHFLGLRKTASDIAKQDAETGSKQLETRISQYNQDAGRLSALDSVPDEEFNQHLLSEGQKLAASQDPQEQQSGQHIMQLAQLPVAQARQQLKVIEHALLGEKEQHEQAFKDAETEKNRAAAARDKAETGWQRFPELGLMYNTETGVTKSVLPGGGGAAMTPGMLESKYVALAAKKAAKQPLSSDDAAFMQGYEKFKTLVPITNFNLQNAGATGSNGQPSAIAKAIADGDMKWNDVISARTPMSVKQSLLAEIKQLKPDFNSGDFDVEKKVREKFTSGNVSDQLMAINTAREHMKTFRRLADALNNGNVQLLNKVGNEIGVQFGSDKATNMHIAAQAFGGEVGRAFDGAGVVASERKQAEDAYKDSLSKGQFSGAIDTVDELLAGKQRSAKQSYDSGREGKPNFGNQGGGGAATTHKVGDLITQNGSTFKVSRVDAKGKVLAADPQ